MLTIGRGAPVRTFLGVYKGASASNMQLVSEPCNLLGRAEEIVCIWQLGLAHFGGLFWPTPGTFGLRGYCSVLLERSP